MPYDSNFRDNGSEWIQYNDDERVVLNNRDAMDIFVVNVSYYSTIRGEMVSKLSTLKDPL